MTSFCTRVHCDHYMQLHPHVKSDFSENGFLPWQKDTYYSLEALQVMDVETQRTGSIDHTCDNQYRLR